MESALGNSSLSVSFITWYPPTGQTSPNQRFERPMSTMADKIRIHPVFRLAEAMGPHHRRSFERLLSEELHRRFDAVAAETLPQPISALIDLLEQSHPEENAG
jgi:hypothetical protein